MKTAPVYVKKLHQTRHFYPPDSNNTAKPIPKSDTQTNQNITNILIDEMVAVHDSSLRMEPGRRASFACRLWSYIFLAESRVWL